MKHFLIKFIVDVVLTWVLNGSLYNSKCPFIMFSVSPHYRWSNVKFVSLLTTICIMYIYVVQYMKYL